MRQIERFAVAVSQFFMLIGCAGTVAMMLHIVADVISKYLFDYPLPGTLEVVSAYYMVAVSFLPLAYAQWHRDHLIVEFATQKLSPRQIRLMDVAVHVLCLAVLVLYTWRTGVAAIAKTGSAEFWPTGFFELLVWPARWILPASLASMALCMLVQILTGFRPRDSVDAVPHV